MKDSIIVLLFLAFVIVGNAVGIWFLLGGSLLDLINGCFNARGCN